MSGLAMLGPPVSAPALKPAPKVSFSRLLNRYLGPAKDYRASLILLEKQKGCGLFDLSRVTDVVRRRALTRHHDIPPVPHLQTLCATFWDAATVPADEPVARLLVGGMLDAQRSKPSDGTATYIDMLVAFLADDVGDFDRKEYVENCASATVIAWAVRKVVKEHKFPPDISEFLALCRELQWKFRSAAMGMERLIELRENAEDVLIVTGDLADSNGEIPF